MQVKTRVKAGLIATNHNETLVRDKGPAPSLAVASHSVRGGRCWCCQPAPNGVWSPLHRQQRLFPRRRQSMLWRRIVTQASFLLVCSQSLIATADTYPAACGGLADRTVILRLCPREMLVPDSASFVGSNDLAEIQSSRQSPSPVPQVLGQDD